MELRELFATFGLDFDQKSVDKADTAMGKLVETIRSFGAALASAAVIHGLIGLVTGVAESANHLSNLSRRTGIATDSLQRMQVVAETVGLDIDGFAESIEDLGEKFTEASRDGGSETAKMFKRLGVDVVDASGNIRTGEDALNATLDAIAQIPNAAERATALGQISGEFRRLGPLVANGRNEFRELIGQLGGFEGITEDAIDGSQEFTRQMAILDFAGTSFRNLLARELLPIMVEVVTTFVGWARAAFQMVKQSNAVKAALIVLTGVIVAAGVATSASWAAPLLLFGLVAVAIGALVLIVDDLITFLEGGDSALGRFLDSLFGVGTAQVVLERIKAVWDSIVGGFRAGVEVISLVVNDLIALFTGGQSAIGQWIDMLFGLGTAAEMVNTIKAAFTALVEVIKNQVMAQFEAFQRAADRVSNLPFVRNLMEAGSVMLNSLRGAEASRQATATVAATPTAVVAPAGAAAGGGTVVTQQTSIPITINGNPNRRELELIRQTVGSELDRRNRQAAAALGEETA